VCIARDHGPNISWRVCSAGDEVPSAWAEEDLAAGDDDASDGGGGALVAAEMQSLELEIRQKEAAMESMCREERAMTQLRGFFEGTIGRLQVRGGRREGSRTHATLGRRGGRDGVLTVCLVISISE
jgi:hypothetical protein